MRVLVQRLAPHPPPSSTSPPAMDRPRSPPAPDDRPPRFSSPPPTPKHSPSDPPRPHSRPDSRLSDSRLLPPPNALPPPRHSTATPHASAQAIPPASPPHKRFKLENPLPPPPPYPCHVDQRWHYSHGPYPTSFYPYPYHQNMPHRVEEMTVDRSISHRSDGPAQYQFMPHSHPTPPPIATLHHSPALSASSLESTSISPSPPITQPSTPYYSHSVSAPPMSQPPPYPYQPNGAMQRYADDPSAPYGVPPGASSLATRSIRPTMVNTQPYPGQANYIIHTDDASTKLSDRVRRKCYNCRTTDTSTWRRSSLTPGKVLCNKCGLFERTHSRPRPEQFPHKRGPVVTQFKQQAHRGTPPPAQMAAQTSQQLQQQRLPSMNAQMLPPHHYSHPSLSPLMAARSADPNQQQQQYRQSGVTEIGALLNGPGEAQSASVGGSPRQAPQQPPMSQQEHQQHQHQHQHQQSTHGVKRPGSPLEQPMHQQPTPEAHGHASPQIAAGSIPNSPRNERREAPSASSTAAAAAAAHRAGN